MKFEKADFEGNLELEQDKFRGTGLNTGST
jgi:hypothetical protein